MHQSMDNLSYQLIERRRVWNQKRILKRLYRKWWDKIYESILPGRILELGGGGGNLKGFHSDILTSDIVFVPWLDVVLDAHTLPFKNECFHNIVMVDVLHYLSAPLIFFREAKRVLIPGGRIIILEPYVSSISHFVYRFLHPEGMDMRVNPLNELFSHKKDPFEGNQAIPTIIFDKNRDFFKRKLPYLRVIKNEKMDLFLYPLSGGFQKICLCPSFLWGFVDAIERRFERWSRYFAFRMLVVIEIM